MGGFFRRLRREKEEAPKTTDKAEEESKDDKVSEGAPRGEPGVEPAGPGGGDRGGPSRAPPSTTTRPGIAHAPEAEPPPSPVSSPSLPSGPPPPLPEADEDAGLSSSRPRSPPHRCFICGAEMDGPWCPTCRMVWNE